MVAEDLDLDVARRLEVPLEEDGVVAERPCGLAPGAGDGLGELGLAAPRRACPCRRRRAAAFTSTG